ncbi:DNA polymerase III subunit gamma/tau [Shouchella clausii]|uniref:DNA polymerase III subunit gamma/tau n=1 Tax=Shouchella clausii TaxID=79880 RepID=UPI000795AD66|nr:DNA polymerase III subunit gamma/tau [Shouchella clausii]KKI84680.1 DNA polymerase III subunit gamma/tau [Shouchella clausii]
MSYQALYRVWRPQLLEDVVGQSHITKTLKNALLQQKLAHAYLFSGPRGTGKTSAAKIVAKAINCKQAPVAEPCNECDACVGITNGSVVDVIEIDAASNNGVDEIRDIRDKVKFAPSEVAYKVYIIDEVHMLSTGAFNALLKTLEEPPAHVIFILATTEPHKIPLTILSRCQRFDFKPISNEALINRMKFILDNNQQPYEEEAIELIARAADGGARDALSLLDQAISFSDEKVSTEDVLTITGAVSREALHQLAAALEKQNARLVLETIDETLKGGKDPKRLLEDLLLYYRDLLLYKTAPETADLFERAVLDDAFVQVAKSYSRPFIYAAIQSLSESQQEMKWALQPKIVLEMAVMKLMQLALAQDTAQVGNEEMRALQEKVKRLEEELASVKQGNTFDKSEPAPAQKERRRMQPRAPQQGKATPAAARELLENANKADLQETVSQWGAIMEKIKGESVPAHAWLSDSKPVAASDTKVLLAFQNEMHRDMMDTKFRGVLCQVLKQTFGNRHDFVTLLNQQWQQIKAEYMKDKQTDHPQEADPLIDEAVKLVGEDLIEIIDS